MSQRIKRCLRRESEAAQKASSRLRCLKHASQFHVGEVWFKGDKLKTQAVCLDRAVLWEVEGWFSGGRIFFLVAGVAQG